MCCSGILTGALALALYPILDVTALQSDELPTETLTILKLELEAYHQISENYEPDLEIQRLIQGSLGQNRIT